MDTGNKAAWIAVVLVAGLALLWLGVLRPSSLEYRATYEETVATSSNGYDDFDRLLDDISSNLTEANRAEGFRIQGKRYLGENALQCDVFEYVCEADEKKFVDPYGCGCMPKEEAATSTEGELEKTQEDAEELILNRDIVFGEEFRLGLDDVVGIGSSGDALWIERFIMGTNQSLPVIEYRIYVASTDESYVTTSDEEGLLYLLEEKASDYATYVDLIITEQVADIENNSDLPEV